MVGSTFRRVGLFWVLFLAASAAIAQPSTPYGSPYGELLPPPPMTPYPSTGVQGPNIAPPVNLPPVTPILEPPGDPSADVVLPSVDPEEPEEVVEPVAIAWYNPKYWLQPPGWNTGFELGLNGASGTSDSLSVRAGGYTKLENDRRKVKIDLYHNRTNAEGVDTQNNARFNARHDWLLGKSPWTIYGLTQVYYDEFQAFDLNVNVNSGFGYKFIDTDPLKLSGTLGSGASREFGGPDDEWVPEAQFGWEYEHQIVENQRFYAKMDYFPEWSEFGRYRLLSDMGWEIELLEPSNLSLKISATDRYDSDPGGVNPHNLNYSVLLLWKL